MISFITIKHFHLSISKKVYLCTSNFETECPGGGIGRRVGLKHQ